MTTHLTAAVPEGSGDRPASGPREFPVREYISAMAVELAQMARWDGDEALGRILDSAAALAGERPEARAVELQPARQRRSA